MFDDTPSGVMRAPEPSAADQSPRLFAQLDAHTESNFFTGFSGDLSDGGLFVVTYEPLEVGDKLRVELSLPGGRFVSVKGTVAWHRMPHHGVLEMSPGVGIVLHDLEEEAATLIRTFMSLREPGFVDPDVLSRDACLRGNAASMLPPAIEPEAEAKAEARSSAEVEPVTEAQAATPEPTSELDAVETASAEPGATDAPATTQSASNPEAESAVAQADAQPAAVAKAVSERPAQKRKGKGKRRRRGKRR